MKTGKRLSIIIISRNTRDLLDSLLKSVDNDTSIKPYISEVILVDNASTDGTEELIRQFYPWVRHVKNGSNVGFARAVNIGTAHASGDFILLLNSDTLFMKGEMLKVLSFMEGHEGVGVCGPQLVYPDMKPQRSFAYRPSLLLEIVPEPALELFMPRRYASRKGIYSEPFEVDSLIGAAVMIHRRAIEHTGGFDESFFFFLEETDFCIRVREKGLKIIFFPGASVIHLQGKTVKKNWIEGRIEYNISLHKFIRKHHSNLYYSIFGFIRVLKCVFMVTAYSVLPFLLISEKARTRYRYYCRLFAWHMNGRPEEGGLRVSKEKM